MLLFLSHRKIKEKEIKVDFYNFTLFECNVVLCAHVYLCAHSTVLCTVLGKGSIR